MTSEKLTRWLAIGGNAAVVVGLLLLVYELNQTRELTQAQMRSEISRGIYDLLAMTANNEQLADLMQTWFNERAADGFNLMPPILPAMLDVFVDEVVPILQRRGLFRTAYEGRTLRDSYGLDLPPSQFD